MEIGLVTMNAKIMLLVININARHHEHLDRPLIINTTIGP